MTTASDLLPAPDQLFAEKKILIFIVAYNAATTIGQVLTRIPAVLRRPNVEVLIIDDYSKDSTFDVGAAAGAQDLGFKLTVLRNPENQGYGGNQKLGYEYAIQHGFDAVALVHGDGQYAPEKLPELLRPLLTGEADAVFGSRMLRKKDAIKGGMPIYKWLGNQVLTRFQNAVLGTTLSEFHSGYRLYAVAALRQIPFHRNSDDFHFDTDIIIQLVWKGSHILELPIPTFYGEEICHVNGLKYAWDIFKTMLRAMCHRRNLLYDRKFDVLPAQEAYDLKLGYTSSHTLALNCLQRSSYVLDLDCGRGLVAEEAAKTARKVVGLRPLASGPEAPANVEFHHWNVEQETLPVDAAEYDQIIMLDVIEHLRDPELFMENLRRATAMRRPEIILTTANIGFVVTRLLLAVGQFNYGRQGILDRTHKRLFTFRSLRELLQQSGYDVVETKGVPAPFPKLFGLNHFSRALVTLHQGLIRLNRRLFSYQIFIRCNARPTVETLLQQTLEWSEVLHEEKAIRAERPCPYPAISRFLQPAKDPR